MKQNRSKKIILTILIAVFVLFVINSTDIFAAVSNYSGVDTVTDTALEEAFEGSSILGLLARLIYAVGRFLEWILGLIFNMLTGTTDFPWADKIVFNSVALLDVNFINPASGSFVGNTAIQGVLKKLYSTVLSLSVAFFGITVLITAIKLVISTVASEKAKYKQAIVDWLIGFLMLFCMHYFISFVFYLNEQLVQEAVNITKSQLAKTNNIAQVYASELQDDLLKNIDSKLGKNYSATLGKKKNFLSTWLSLDSSDNSKGAQEYFMKNNFQLFDTATADVNQYERLYSLAALSTSPKLTTEKLSKYKTEKIVFAYQQVLDTPNYYQAMLRTDFDEMFKGKNGVDVSYINKNGKVENLKDIVTINNKVTGCKDGNGEYNITSNAVNACADNNKVELIVTTGSNKLSKSKKQANAVDGTEHMYNQFHLTDLITDLINLRSAAARDLNADPSTGAASNAGTVRLIADLATYFRNNSYDQELRSTNKTGLKNGDNIQIQNMIMYAILVAQSLILFISYIKRLFYVLMLAMLAPVVVVFDFFKKFGK